MTHTRINLFFINYDIIYLVNLKRSDIPLQNNFHRRRTPTNMQISQSNIRVLSKIGRGSQAEVFLVEDPISKVRLAMKVISIRSELQEKDKKRIELQIMSNLYISNEVSSINFPKIVQYYFNPQSINIFFELCDENAQSAYKKLKNSSQRYNFLVVMLFDMLSALQILQKINIIHRDIKPENILLKMDVFKLGDLGLSRIYDQGNYFTNDIGNRLGRSPEFVSGLYNFKTDIWSLGVHLFYMLQNTLPFDENSLINIQNNPNDIEKIITFPQFQVNLQPQGRRSKNVLSFLHMILAQMIVIDPRYRAQAGYLLSSYFTCNDELSVKNIIRITIFGYLSQRQSYGQYYLILLLGYIDFYRLDDKMGSEQTNKKKICLRVKLTIYQILKLTLEYFCMQLPSKVSTLMVQLLQLWQAQLAGQITPFDINSGLNNISDALDIYKISKVRQKFPLVEWMVKLYKTAELLKGKVNCRRISIWEIPIELSKLL